MNDKESTHLPQKGSGIQKPAELALYISAPAIASILSPICFWIAVKIYFPESLREMTLINLPLVLAAIGAHVFYLGLKRIENKRPYIVGMFIPTIVNSLILLFYAALPFFSIAQILISHFKIA